MLVKLTAGTLFLQGRTGAPGLPGKQGLPGWPGPEGPKVRQLLAGTVLYINHLHILQTLSNIGLRQ